MQSGQHNIFLFNLPEVVSLSKIGQNVVTITKQLLSCALTEMCYNKNLGNVAPLFEMGFKPHPCPALFTLTPFYLKNRKKHPFTQCSHNQYHVLVQLVWILSEHNEMNCMKYTCTEISTFCDVLLQWTALYTIVWNIVFDLSLEVPFLPNVWSRV